MALTKSELVSIIANHTGLTKKETQTVIDGFLNTMRHGLRRRKRVELRGFGNFLVVHRKARMARNPLTNEPVYVKEHDTVAFRPSKHLKGFLNIQTDEQE
jgi:nucleoid DNA-binding protein